MRLRFDIAIVGSGYAGSILAMIARRLGLSVLLLERGRHPRVVIGESSTPLSNLLLEELADRYTLPQLRPLTKWGTWQQSYPDLTCGLKRGFSFFHHRFDQLSDAAPLRDRQLLVAASPNDTIADTHWYRADVDAWLVKQAQELEVEYVDGVTLSAPVRDDDGWRLAGEKCSETLSWHAKLLLDATGPRGFLHNALGLGECPLPDYPQTAALYSHFRGVTEFSGTRDHISPELMYPVDAAALHHVFDGGWMWLLRFSNGVTSAGVAAEHRIADRFRFADKERAWLRILEALPEVRQQFLDARESFAFTYLPQLGFQSAAVAGDGWALLPAAAGFVDPLLSTGFSLNLLGITRLAALLERDFGKTRRNDGLQDYAAQTVGDLLATARLIAGLYRSMADFDTFRSISLLYFAAVSYSESARRLGRPEMAASFLLRDHPVFGPRSRELLARVHPRASEEEKLRLRQDIHALIEPFDVAGFTLQPADHCYPVRADDLLASAPKLGVQRQEVEQMLARSGLFAASAFLP